MTIRTVGVVGCGLMGSGIVELCAKTGYSVVVREVDGVPIPFASPRLLWRMKVVTHREKDTDDLLFLRQWFARRGEDPPQV